MFLEFSDWLMYVDKAATRTYHAQEAQDRCLCDFCKNFYGSVDAVYPDLRYFLSRFGVDIEAPESLTPITAELYQASYLVQGKILRFGVDPIWVHDIAIMAEECEQESFLLQIGLMKIPWTLPHGPINGLIPNFFQDHTT